MNSINPNYVDTHESIREPSGDGKPERIPEFKEPDNNISKISEIIKSGEPIENLVIVHHPKNEIQPSGLPPEGVRGTYFELIPRNVINIIINTLREGSLERRENLIAALKEIKLGSNEVTLRKNEEGAYRLKISTFPYPQGFMQDAAAFYIVKEYEIYQQTKNYTKNLDFLGAPNDTTDLAKLIKDSKILNTIEKYFYTLMPELITAQNILNNEFLRVLNGYALKKGLAFIFSPYDRLDILYLLKDEMNKPDRLESLKNTLLVSTDCVRLNVSYNVAEITRFINNPNLLNEMIVELENKLSDQVDDRFPYCKELNKKMIFSIKYFNAELYGE